LGCTTTADRAQVGEAQRLEGWQGVNKIFRDGQFYFSGQPNETVFRRLAEQEGIKLVVNIRLPRELGRLGFDEPDLVAELGMEYVNIPITTASLSAGDVDRFAEVLAHTRGPVLIHCQTSDRVGALWAAYLARVRGVDIEDAIDQGKAVGLGSQSRIDAVRRVAHEP